MGGASACRLAGRTAACRHRTVVDLQAAAARGGCRDGCLSVAIAGAALLQLLAAQFHWWNFAGEDDMLVGLPIDVWIGWAIWWGPVVVFANRWLTLPLLVVLSVLIDLATMPWLTPLVELGPQWTVGDAVAVTLCLAPGLWMARLTRDDRSPKRRAMFHVLGWGGYIVLVIPVSVLSYVGAPLAAFYHWPHGLLDGA